MKVILTVFGILLSGSGLVWALQGANVLPGSFMTGDPFWLVTGIACVIAGAGLIFFANRRSGPHLPDA